MEKLLKFISLDSLRGVRTKLTLVADALLYSVALLAPEFLSVELWSKLQPLFIAIGGMFYIDHLDDNKKS